MLTKKFVEDLFYFLKGKGLFVEYETYEEYSDRDKIVEKNNAKKISKNDLEKREKVR